MKILAIFFLLLSLQSNSKTFFQPHLDHSNAHELVWSFSESRPDWGKNDKNQVRLDCLKNPIPEFDVYWNNAQTLKTVFKNKLSPGIQCQAQILNLSEKFYFKTPLIKVNEIYPWDFENLDEDSAFILKLEAPIDPQLIAQNAYVEVEGSNEKVELDVVTGPVRSEVLKSQYLEDLRELIVLRPRRNFPLNKNVVFVLPEAVTFFFKKQGHVRNSFEVNMTCERTYASAPCSPFGTISLNFNSDVALEDLKKIKIIHEKKEYPLHFTNSTYQRWASFNIKLDASQTYEIHIPASLEDMEGRKLSNSNKFPLTVKTGIYPPLAKFPGPFGVLEANTEMLLPLSVRNIEKVVTLKKTSSVIKKLDPLTIMKWKSAIDKRQNFSIPDLRDQSIFNEYKVKTQNETLKYTASENETEVLGLPLKEKGLHIIEVSSPAIAESLLQKTEFYTSTAVLVTNMAAHLKMSEKNSLVWVTTLDKGEAVSDAEVTLYDCNGKVLQKGKTNNTGLLLFSKVTLENLNCSNHKEEYSSRIIAVATKGDDSTFTFSDWTRGIESWRFSLPWRENTGPIRAHTVFDRPVYKQGEKVHMIHLVRDQSEAGLKYPKEKFTHLLIQHLDTGKDWSLAIKWKDAGTALTYFSLPEEAPQGNYGLSLVTYLNGVVAKSIEAGHFTVQAFRIPLMRSDLSFKEQRTDYSEGEELELLGHLEFMAGGSGSDTNVTLRTEVVPLTQSTYFKDYEGYLFTFGEISDNKESGTILEKKTLKTDAKGDFSFKFSQIPKSNKVQNLRAEIEYIDPNGAFQTNSLSALIYPHNKLIGFKNPKNVYSTKINEKVSFELLMIDRKKMPLSDENYKIKLYKRINLTNRKKILGGFYTYHNTSKIEDMGEVCAGQTNKKGLAICELSLKAGGDYYLVAKSGDSSGQSNFYIYGDQNSWNEEEYNDRIDILADKNIYSAGEKAVFKLKTSFEHGLVLITKERAGILKTYLTSFERKNPFIVVPIEQEDYPNIFISALIVRGRLAQGQATGIIDLAKPAYKLGLIEVQVQDKNQALFINVVPDKAVYKVREKVKLTIQVKNADGTPAKNQTAAISVFDEGLLTVNAQDSFDPLKSLMQSFRHSVVTATAQTHIIGKRHFGLKARPQGGGGGKDQQVRQMFDTLVYWNPKIQLDKSGMALVEFPLNDSLTTFSIKSLAYGEKKFGKHKLSIQSSQDILSFAGTSPFIRTGDQFSARYTLKNVTSNSKTLRIELWLNGVQIKKEKFNLLGGASSVVSQEIAPFKTTGTAQYSLKVFEGNELLDELRTSQIILPLYTPRVQFSDLKEIKGEVLVPASSENSFYAGTQVIFSSSLLPGPETFRSYMRSYFYNCFEQQLARTIIMEDKKLFKKLDKEIDSYIDSRGLLKFYPRNDQRGSISLTAHFLEMAYWEKLPFKRIERLQYALKQFISGEMKDLESWERENFEFLKHKAMVVLKLSGSPHFNPAWLSDVSTAKESDSLSILIDKWILFFPGNQALIAHDLIRFKLKIDGSTIVLDVNDNEDIFSSSSAVSARFLLLQKTMAGSSKFDEFYKSNEGKFVRGFLGQQKSGHYSDTVSNTYAYILQKKWSKSAVSGTTTLGGIKSSWKDGEAPFINVSRENGLKDNWLKHNGTGTPWADLRYLVYPDPQAQTFQGIELKQSLSQTSFKIQDRIILKLNINLKSKLNMGGIRIPMPAGVSILNVESSEVPFDFEERTEQEWRGYFNHLPKGQYNIEITLRLNQPGDFEIPGTRMEALYSPDIFGELPYWNMRIQE